MNVTPDEIFLILKSAGISVDIAKISNETILRKAGVDSLDMMNILLSLEEKYCVKIPDSEALKLDSVNSIVEYLRRR